MTNARSSLLSAIDSAEADLIDNAVLELGMHFAEQLRAVTKAKPELLEVAGQISDVICRLDRNKCYDALSYFLYLCGNDRALQTLPIDLKGLCLSYLDDKARHMAPGNWFYDHIASLLCDPWSISFLHARDLKAEAEMAFEQFAALTMDWYYEAIRLATKDLSELNSWDFDEYEQGMSRDIVISNLINRFSRNVTWKLKVEIFDRFQSLGEIISRSGTLDLDSATIPLAGSTSFQLKLGILECWKEKKADHKLRLIFHSHEPFSDVLD
jgi:hypothetical protein